MAKTANSKRMPAGKTSSRSRLTNARLKYQEGDYHQCLRVCQFIYIENPSDVGNLLLVSACHFQLNQMRESVFYGQQAIGVDPTLVEAHVAVGNALIELGDLESASHLYNKALRLQPRFPHAYAGLGLVHFQKDRFEEAISSLEMAVSLDLSFGTILGLVLIAGGEKTGGRVHLAQQIKSSAIARLGMANLAHEDGDFDEAIEHYSEALRMEPSFIDAASNLCGSYIESYKATNSGNSLLEASSRLEQVVASYKNSQAAHSKLGLCHRYQGRHKLAHRYLWRAVTLDPTNADVMCNLAALHAETGDHMQAVKLCLSVLQLHPDHEQAFGTLGLALFQLGFIDIALACLRTAEKLKPNSYVCSNLGSILNDMGDSLAAATLLKKAIALDPFNAPAFVSLGNAYFDCGRLEYAEKCYQTSIESKTKHNVTALNNLALLHLSRGQFDKSICSIMQLRAKLDSTSIEISSTLAITDAYACQWANRSKSFEMITGCNMHNMTIQPFFTQIIPQINPGMARGIFDKFSQRMHQRALHKSTKIPYQHAIPGPGDLVRIGYVSSGFGNHTTSFIIHGVIGRHKRTKFEVICFALSPSDNSPEWCTIEEKADKMVDLNKLHCVNAAADKINELGIHILVDLDGYCQGSLPEIFTLRPAPIQITMNCGTMGSESGIDYIIGDEFTIPERCRSAFSEKIIYMPTIANSYRDITQNVDNDSSKIRQQYGISDDAFVYACFSQPYKIDPELFTIWMEVLHEVPNSLLVLLRYSNAMEENLRREISKHQIADDRVMFLGLVPRNQHLVRCCIADVFLDTQLCSGIATGCDALFSAAPMITIADDRMCSRIGGSLLASLGVEDFVVSNLVEYKELAISLSQDEEKFIDIIHLLDEARDTSALFDCEMWVCAFEAAIESVVERHRQGLEPDHIIRLENGQDSNHCDALSAT